MSGLATVITRILDDLNRGVSASARVSLAIYDAIKFFRAERFTWNQKRSNFQVSTEYTSFSADWIETDALNLQRTSNEIDPLIEKNWKWINQRSRDDNTSDPLYYASEYNQLRLYPIPDRTYSVELHYHFDLLAGQQLVSLSASWSTGWLNEGEQMIRLHAQGDVLINYIKGPEAVAEGNICQGQADAIFKKLRRRKNRADGAGRIEPWL
jgi:hypothetical protein